MQTPDTISAKDKNLCWWLAWLGAGLIIMCPPTAVGFPVVLVSSWLFPLGLVGVFRGLNTELPGLAVLCVGWILYVVLTFFGLKERNRSRFYLFYAVLIILLVFNAAGCRLEIKTVKISS